MKEEKKDDKKTPPKASSQPHVYSAINDDLESESSRASFLTDEEAKLDPKAKIRDAVILNSLSLKIGRGEFVCVIGEVGSGKSSLISALLGDMIHVGPETLATMGDSEMSPDTLDELIRRSKEQGVIRIAGSVSLVQQVPWIQNKTIRDNILFGLPMDVQKYNATIEACCLGPDLEILSGGDLTEIGEKGINLSGGQKARVSLARAVYADRDVVLMDDPISALDANVKKKIFRDVFSGLLKDKTRVLVTHAIDFLEHVDRIVIMDKGRITAQGSFDDLRSHEGLQHIIHIQSLTRTQPQDSDIEQEITGELALKEPTLFKKLSSEDSRKQQKDHMAQDGSNITKNEDDEIITIGFSTYGKYLKGSFMWGILIFFIWPLIFGWNWTYMF